MDPRLAALVVHDLKNALGALEGQLGALEAAPTAAAARDARLHCAQLRRRFVAFLTLYRGDELRALASDESPADFLDGLVRHAVPEPGAPATLRRGPCVDAPAFGYFDPRLVRLALDAALHNAWRFARREIVIDAAACDGGLVFTVDDDGPGLGAADPDGTHATGLGTELCRAIARAHRHGDREGRVRLVDRPGGGARFELWLP